MAFHRSVFRGWPYAEIFGKTLVPLHKKWYPIPNSAEGEEPMVEKIEKAYQKVIEHIKNEIW